MATPAQDLNDKLRLEAELRPELQAYNRSIVREFTRKVGLSDNIPDFFERNDDLAEILTRHYELTGRVFSDRLRRGLPDDVAITDGEAAEIAAALATFYPREALTHAREINRTTQGDASDALAFARDEQVAAAADDRAISNLEMAAIAGAVLHRRLNGRLISTVMTETQGAAEAAKATEAEVLTGVPPTVSGGSPQQPQVNKEWVTVGDSRVREDHINADGQQRLMNTPFDVGGEQLRWPGDSSLGATAGNIINCRCGAGYDEQGIIETRRAQERPA